MPRPPSNGRVTSPFGRRPAPVAGASTNHLGEDTIGVGNYAPVTGEVVFAGYYGAWGNIVGIRERANQVVIWWVAHHRSISVHVGQQTTEGATYLGPMGRTGNVSGVHAHTERRVGGVARPGTGTATNPRNFYTAAAGGSGEIITEPEPRYSPMTDTRLIWAAHLSTPGNNRFFRAKLGSDVIVDSLYSQVQANAAAFMIAAPTITVQSDADLKAQLVVMKSIPPTGGVDPALITAAIEAAFEDVEIPTPSISPEDIQAIANGTVAKLGASITDG